MFIFILSIVRSGHLPDDKPDETYSKLDSQL